MASKNKKAKSTSSLKSMLTLYLGGLLVMLMVGNFVLNILSARHYLQGQLETQAQDAATALGMSLSSVFVAGDEITASSVIDAMFDHGYYEHIILWHASGDTWIVRQAKKAPDTVPGWFTQLIELNAPIASADVVKGWSRLGSVALKLNPGQAYLRLWQTVIAELAWFALVFILAMVALTVILSVALKPVASLVTLANGVMNRDFSLRAVEVGAKELVQVSQSMNLMAARLEHIFKDQVDQIHLLRSEVHLDPVTQVLNRSEFDRRLVAELESRERYQEGELLLLQIRDFAEFNNRFGREAGDGLLLSVAREVGKRVEGRESVLIGRRTGADFSVYVPGMQVDEAETLASSLIHGLIGVKAIKAWCREDVVHVGLATSGGHTAKALLSNADMALRKAQSEQASGWQRFLEPTGDTLNLGLRQSSEWREELIRALDEGNVHLQYQPVFLAEGESVFYYKALARMLHGGEEFSAGYFMPMVDRFDLNSVFDRHIVELITSELDDVLNHGTRIGVSIATESALDTRFVHWLRTWLLARPLAAECLVVELPEYVLQKSTEAFLAWFSLAEETGATLVVDKFGLSSLPFSYLKKYPVKWLKIDRHYLEGLERNRENRFYIQSVIQIAHSLDIQVIAYGVENKEEWLMLKELGVDAGAGFGLQKPLPEITFPTGE